MVYSASNSGVRNLCSFSRWFEITGLPVFKANPAGDSRSAPTVAEPTTPSSQPTPARTRKRFSAGWYSRTLQNSAWRPSATRRVVSFRSSRNSFRCSAKTPSSARISCCRIRTRSARVVASKSLVTAWIGLDNRLFVVRWRAHGDQRVTRARWPRERNSRKLDNGCLRVSERGTLCGIISSPASPPTLQSLSALLIRPLPSQLL